MTGCKHVQGLASLDTQPLSSQIGYGAMAGGPIPVASKDVQPVGITVDQYEYGSIIVVLVYEMEE